jgi:hypothetical protein
VADVSSGFRLTPPQETKKKIVRGLLRFSPCDLLLLEAGNCDTGTVREPRGRGTSPLEAVTKQRQ